MLRTFFFSENRAVYEITWKNIAEPDINQSININQISIWRLRNLR